MFSNGYVGTGEDVQRIRRMEKQREEQRKKFEAMHKQTKDQADAAGLRQFGASTEEVGRSLVSRQWVASRGHTSKGLCGATGSGGGRSEEGIHGSEGKHCHIHRDRREMSLVPCAPQPR